MEKIYHKLLQQKLRRTDDGYLGGVLAGISHLTGISVTLLRIVTVLLAFAGGATIVAYGLAWLLIPHYPSNKILLSKVLQGETSSKNVAAIVFTILGLLIAIPLLLLLGVDIYYYASSLYYLPGAYPDLATDLWLIFIAFASLSFPIVGIALLVWFLHRKRKNRSTSYAHNEYPNFTAHTSIPPYATTDTPFLAEMSKMQTAPKTPAISKRFIAVTIALILASIAFVILLGDTSLRTHFLGLGLPITILGGAIIVAGIRGMRATWLTALAWLLAPVVSAAAILGFVAPPTVLDNPHTRILDYGRHSTRDTSALGQMNQVVDTSELQPGSRTVLESVVTDISINAKEDDAVIIRIEGMRNLDLHYLQPWKLEQANTEEYTPHATVQALSNINTDDLYEELYDYDDIYESDYDTELNDPYDDDNLLNNLRDYTGDFWHSEFDIENGGKVVLYSPAAAANPQNAKEIIITSSYADIDINGLAPDKFSNRTWALQGLLEAGVITEEQSTQIKAKIEQVEAQIKERLAQVRQQTTNGQTSTTNNGGN